MSLSSPPLDGSVSVLPGFLDFHAEYNSERPWAMFPSASGTEVTTVSFGDLARATHRVAHLSRPNREGADGEVVGVLINCDTILYIALLVGMVRAGLVPFPISPRNSPAAVAHLLKQTSSHRLISQPSLSSLVDATQRELGDECYTLSVDRLPDLYDIFPTIAECTTAIPVLGPYRRVTQPRPRDEVVLYLHSSGSTGFPKVIPQTDVTILEWCKTPILDGVRRYGVIWAAMPLPTFHTMGVYAQVYSPLMSGYPIGLYCPQAPLSPVVPTPQNVLEVSRKLGCTGIPVVPAFVEVWAQSEEDIKHLELLNLKILVTGGGPLSQRCGDRLAAAGIPLCATYGGTEFGTLTTAYDTCDSPDPLAKVKTSADWAWLSFPKEVKHRWIPEDDGTYELQILTSDTYHPSVENLEDTRGYATRDLFKPHPTKPGLWRITGRKDDVLVLGSGEKVVPLPQEGHVTSDVMVAGAVMFGRGKSQCGILIEPRPQCATDPQDQPSVIALRNKLWPIVEEANALAPTFARIFKEMVLFTDPAKPLPRAAKNTIMRRQALMLYDKEIDSLYRTVAESADIKDASPPVSWTSADIEKWLIRLSTDINKNVPVSPTINVFDQGFDSLYATFLRNRIIATLRNTEDLAVREASGRVTQNLVFEHPTIHELASVVSTIVGSNCAEEKDVVGEIRVLLARYSADLPRYIAKSTEYASDDIVVLLTGSTGNVGSHILATLLLDARISTVYTLNRTASTCADERQASAFENRSLPTSLLSQAKLVQLAGDISMEHFGLPENVYDKITSTVTHVVHNAWKVDFNHPLKSFEPLIVNTRSLIDACYTFSRPVRFFYTSSVSAAAGHDPSLGPVPEEPLMDPNAAIATGYGASKFVVEQLLAKAADNGFPATSLRIGQVCGSKETGAWSTKEWVAVMVKSSITLGALPNLDGSVSWIPMDAVATAVAELIVAHEELPHLFNVVHPHRVLWREVLQNISKHLPEGPLPFVDLTDWVTRLESLSETATAEDLERVPAIKLLDFYKMLAAVSQSRAALDTVEAGGTPIFDTVKLQTFSVTIRNLEPLNEEYAKAWINYWRSNDFLCADERRLIHSHAI